LATQLLDNDRRSARLVAEEVGKRLEGRIDRVLGAQQRAWRAVRAGEQEQQALLEGLLKEGERGVAFQSAVLADEKGKILAGARLKGQPGANGKVERKTERVSLPSDAPKHFSWRDWFCGETRYRYEMGTFYPPVAELHLSAPFVSTVPGDGALVGISVPLLDPSDRKAGVRGVLLASLKIGDLSAWFQKVEVPGEGDILLLDRRGHYLHHRNPKFKPRYLAVPTAFPEVRQKVEDALGPDGTGRIDDFHDGIDDGVDAGVGVVAIPAEQPRQEPVAHLRGQVLPVKLAQAQDQGTPCRHVGLLLQSPDEEPRVGGEGGLVADQVGAQLRVGSVPQQGPDTVCLAELK
jgi:hypothetical protein